MALFTTPSQISANYATNTGKTGVYDTQSAIDHIQLASNVEYSHPAVSKPSKYLQAAKSRIDSSKVDSLKQKVPEVRRDSVKALDTLVRSEPLSKPNVALGVSGDEYRRYFRGDSSAVRAEIMDNDTIISYDSAGKVIDERVLSRRDLSAYKRMVKNIEPAYNEVIVIPEKYKEHFTKDISLKDRKNIDRLELVDGNILRAYGHDSKLIEQKLLTSSEIESMRLSQVKEGEAVDLRVSLRDGESVFYSGMVIDSTGRKITNSKDAGFYQVICNFGKKSGDFVEATDTDTLYINVVDVNNKPKSAGKAKPIEIKEGSDMLFSHNYKDDDGDELRINSNTLYRWIEKDGAGNYFFRPGHDAVAKDSSFTFLYTVSDGKDSVQDSVTVKILNDNLRAEPLVIDSNNTVVVSSGDRKAYHLNIADPDSLESNVRKLELKFKKDPIDSSAKVDTSSFDYFIDKILESKNPKQDSVSVDDLADPKRYVHIKDDSLVVVGGKDIVSKDFRQRKLDDIAISYTDGDDTYEIARFSVEFNYKEDEKPKVEEQRKRVNVSTLTADDISKEEKEKLEKERLEVKKVEERQVRTESFRKGSYNTEGRFDVIDARISKDVAYEFAENYKAGRYDLIMQNLPAASQILSKENGSHFSSYKNLKRIVDYMDSNFKGYNSVKSSILKIEALVNNAYNEALSNDSVSADSLKGRTRSARNSQLKVKDYRKAKSAIKRIKRVIGENGLDKNPRCKGIIDTLGSLEKSLIEKKPSAFRQFGYQLTAVGRGEEWRERPGFTVLTALGEAAALTGLYFLGKHAVEVYQDYKFEEPRKDSRNNANDDPDGIGPNDSDQEDFIDSSGNDITNDTLSDSNSSDSADSQQNLFRILRKVLGQSSDVSSSKSISPYFNAAKKEFGIIFKRDF